MKNIYVGNVNFQTTEQEIRSMFEAYGSVDRVNIVTDRDSGPTPWLCVCRNDE